MNRQQTKSCCFLFLLRNYSLRFLLCVFVHVYVDISGNIYAHTLGTRTLLHSNITRAITYYLLSRSSDLQFFLTADSDQSSQLLSVPYFLTAVVVSPINHTNVQAAFLYHTKVFLACIMSLIVAKRNDYTNRRRR